MEEKWILDYKREHGESCLQCGGELLFGLRAKQEVAKRGGADLRVIAYCPNCDHAIVRHLRPEDCGFPEDYGDKEEWKKSTGGWQHTVER